MHKFTFEDLKKLVEIAKEYQKVEEEGRSQENKGHAHYKIGQYQKAIQRHLKVLEIVEELGDKGEVGKAHGNLGIAYSKIGQYQKAIECHRKDLEIAEELRDKRRVGIAHGHLGNAYKNIGQFQKALECHRKDLEIAEELGDKCRAGIAHGNLGNAYYNIGQYQKAIECHRKHLEIAEELEDKGGVARAHANLGNAYNDIGQYQKAIECHRKSLEISEELGDKGGVGKSHGNLGTAYANIGLYQKAIECHKKLKIAKELGDEDGVGTAYANLGCVHNSTGQYEKAIEYHHKHLKNAEELGRENRVGKTHGHLGIAHSNIGQYQKAIEFHCKHLEISEKLGDKAGVGRAHGNLGTCYYCLGQHQKAIVFVNRCLQIIKEIKDIRGKVNAENLLGIFHQKDDVCLSSSFFAQSILSFHSIRRYGISEDQLNTSLSNLSNHTHKSLFLNLLNLKQVKAALLISDAGKAKALFDLTRRCVDVVLDSTLEDNYTIPIQAISDDPSSKTTEEFLNDVLSKVINLTVKDGSIISYTFDPRDILHAWIVCEKGVFHKKWKTINGISTKTYLKTINIGLRDSLVRNMPKSDSFPPNVYSFDTVVKGKFTDELVVTGEKDERENNYARDLDKRIENLTINNNSEVMPPNCDPKFLDVKSVKERYNLDSSSSTQPGRNREQNDNDEETFLGRYSLEIPNTTPSRTRKETSDRASSTKKTNDEVSLKNQYSVYISPIEEYLVGSKILVSPEDSLFHVPFCALLNPKNEHLCERYSIQFTPALHVLNASLSKPLAKVGSALFVGNPIVGEVEFHGQLVSPDPLPNATVEAKECSKCFGAEPLLEENATKEKVLMIMKEASIIHIAAHGHMDNADIFLAPNEGAPKPPSEEHYLLTATDVTKCTLVARFVVLSCCHSGRGQISAEGVVGIARSFLGAGARSVLVTICRIPDEATMIFMKDFYDKVVQGLSVCVALQRSMIELKKKYPISAWAPFQIVGEDIALSSDEIEEIRHISCIR